MELYRRGIVKLRWVLQRQSGVELSNAKAWHGIARHSMVRSSQAEAQSCVEMLSEGTVSDCIATAKCGIVRYGGGNVLLREVLRRHCIGVRGEVGQRHGAA